MADGLDPTLVPRAGAGEDDGARAHTILVIDDDEDIRLCLTILLSSQGYEVVEAGDGDQALDCLHSGPRPCVILLDLFMPRMNGFEFRRRQRALPEVADIPTVVFTAAAHLPEIRDLAAADVLRKPIHLDDLLAALGKICPAPAPA